MIDLLYTKSDTELSQSLFEHYLNRLPLNHQQQLLGYKNRRDQQACLLGKLLLLEGLNELNKTNIFNLIKYNQFGKPFISSELRFNIAHSGEMVVCVLGKCELGIDIEKIESIELEDFKNIFSNNEWRYIMNSEFPVQEFYNYWTKKESVMKADGRGLTIPLKEILILKNCALLQGAKWYLHKINLDSNYIIHLASKFPESYNMREIDFSSERAKYL